MPIQSFCIKLYKSKNKDWQQGIFQNIESEVWLFCIKYGNSLLDILLLRTNMSEWKVWVTMPQVAAPSQTLRYSRAVSRQPCPSVSAASLYLSRPNVSTVALCFSISTASSPLFPPCVQWGRQFAPCGLSSAICPLWNVIRQHWKTFFLVLRWCIFTLIALVHTAVFEMRDQGPGPSSTG